MIMKNRKRDNHVNEKLTAFDLGYKKGYKQNVTSVAARTMNINEEDWPIIVNLRFNPVVINNVKSNIRYSYEELV